MWEKRAARTQDLVGGLLPVCVTLAIAGAAGMGVAAKGVAGGDTAASAALLLFVVAFLALLPPTGSILGLRGGLFSSTTLKLLARLDPKFAEPDREAAEFMGEIELEPLPDPGWQPANESDEIPVRLAEVERVRAETWKRSAASRERVLRQANDLLVVSFGLFVMGAWALLLAQYPG